MGWGSESWFDTSQLDCIGRGDVCFVRRYLELVWVNGGNDASWNCWHKQKHLPSHDSRGYDRGLVLSLQTDRNAIWFHFVFVVLEIYANRNMKRCVTSLIITGITAKGHGCALIGGKEKKNTVQWICKLCPESHNRANRWRKQIKLFMTLFTRCTYRPQWGMLPVVRCIHTLQILFNLFCTFWNLFTPLKLLCIL